MFDEFVPKAAEAAVKPKNMFDEFVHKDEEHLVKAGLAGIAKGGANLAGGLGDIRDLAAKATEYVGAKLGVPDLKEKAAAAVKVIADQPTALGGFAKLATGAPTGAEVRHGLEENVTGPLYEPKTRGEKFAGTIGEFLPGAALGPMGSARTVAANVARYGAVPGAVSEGAGQLAEALAPKLEGPARMATALLTPWAAGRVITPRAITQEAKDIQKALEREGVHPTVGQVSENRNLKYRESELRPEINQEQARQVSAAAGRRIGLNGELPTTGENGNFPKQLKKIGDQFQQLSQRNTLRGDSQLAQDLTDTYQHYHDIPGVHEKTVTDAVDGVIRRLNKAFQATGGTIPGSDYQTMRSRLKAAAMSADKTNPDKGTAIHDLVEALDDAMERSIAKTNPKDAGLWPQARRDYRNALVLEKALGTAGSDAFRGIVTPEQVASAAKSIYGKRVYLKGEDDFSKLTEPAASILKPLSDPAQDIARHNSWRRFTEALPHTIGGIGGAAAGHHLGGTEAAVLGLLAGELGGRVVAPAMNAPTNAMSRALLTSRPGVAWQTNRIIPRDPADRWHNLDPASAYNMLRALQQGDRPAPAHSR